MRRHPNRSPFWKNSNDLDSALHSRRFQNIVLYRGNAGAGRLTLTKELHDSYVDIDALNAKRLDKLGESL